MSNITLIFPQFYPFHYGWSKNRHYLWLFCHSLDACHTVHNHLISFKFFPGVYVHPFMHTTEVNFSTKKQNNVHTVKNTLKHFFLKSERYPKKFKTSNFPRMNTFNTVKITKLKICPVKIVWKFPHNFETKQDNTKISVDFHDKPYFLRKSENVDFFYRIVKG